VTAGTIFARTRVPLRLWFEAAWLMTSQKHGISALGVQRALGLGSYQTAWAMLHRFRVAMVRPGREHLSGHVEVDEAYVGGVEEGVADARRRASRSSRSPLRSGIPRVLGAYGCSRCPTSRRRA